MSGIFSSISSALISSSLDDGDFSFLTGLGRFLGLLGVILVFFFEGGAGSVTVGLTTGLIFRPRLLTLISSSLSSLVLAFLAFQKLATASGADSRIPSAGSYVLSLGLSYPSHLMLYSLASS